MTAVEDGGEGTGIEGRGLGIVAEVVEGATAVVVERGLGGGGGESTPLGARAGEVEDEELEGDTILGIVSYVSLPSTSCVMQWLYKDI